MLRTKGNLAGSEDSDDRCHYVVPRKKRRCRMLVKPGHSFCGEHRHLLDPKDLVKETEPTIGADRILCPNDPKHSCSKTKLEKHLLVCPSKPKPEEEHISKGVNAVPSDQHGGSDSKDKLTIASVSDNELIDIINRVDVTFKSKVDGKISTSCLKQEAIERELDDPNVGPAARKHLVQNSSLLGNLESSGVFNVKHGVFVEFGSGRGLLTFWVAKSSKPEMESKFALIDKASHRHKYDNKIKDQPHLEIIRIRADIQDLVLSKIDPIKNGNSPPVISISKHLCGGATDLALRCLETFMTSHNGNLEAIMIALCCHHRCDWNLYVGKEFLMENGFDSREFSLLCGLTSWATCGSGTPRSRDDTAKKSGIDASKNEKHFDRYNRLKLDRPRREEIGRRCKNLIDMGRLQYVIKILGLQNSKLSYYVDSSVTLENVLLWASK